MSTHTQIISAAMAVPRFRGTAILLIVTIGSAKERTKTSVVDKTEFVTLVLDRMNLSTVHKTVRGKMRRQ